MSNAWYEVLSVLHLMAMLSLSQANLLLLPRSSSSDGHLPKVSEGWYKILVYVNKFVAPSLNLSYCLIYQTEKNTLE